MDMSEATPSVHPFLQCVQRCLPPKAEQAEAPSSPPSKSQIAYRRILEGDYQQDEARKKEEVEEEDGGPEGNSYEYYMEAAARAAMTSPSYTFAEAHARIERNFAQAERDLARAFDEAQLDVASMRWSAEFTAHRKRVASPPRERWREPSRMEMMRASLRGRHQPTSAVVRRA